MKRASCGLDVNFPIEICRVLKSASTNGYDFVCIPLVHPRFKREFTLQCKNRKGPFTRPDIVLKSTEWNTLIAGKISPYLDIELECLSSQSKFALEQELNFGSHLDLPAIIIPLRSLKCFSLAQIVNSNLFGLKTYQIWIEVPLMSRMKEASVWRSDEIKEGDDSTWEWWNRFFTLCNSDKRLGVILELTNTLPPQEELDRWFGEPIKCLTISTNIFCANKNGYPILAKPHQIFIKSLVSLDIQVIIKGNTHHQTLDCYQKYIDHLYKEATIQQNLKLAENLTPLPVQKFSDDFTPKKYEIMEKDVVKYIKYSEAFHQALLERETEDENSESVNVMIVGRGKVQMISIALQAATIANKKIKIYAVESNSHAIATLRSYQEELWHDSVELLFGDCLSCFPRKIDILLSDLLSSFGDNELCPEILDKAQNYLKEDGICIPKSYTSFICPIQNSKAYGDLKNSQNRLDCEIPYIDIQKNKCNLAPTKSLFNFCHPNYCNPVNNSRHHRLTFDISQNSVLHGFSGFFEAVLYKDIKFSIVPESHTPGLYSWHPIYFPLIEPVHLKAGDQVEVCFWRVVSNKMVWYEWTITKPVPLPIHNTNGRSSNVSL